MEEIEAKFLEINKKEIVEKLEKLGAKKEFDILYRRRVFDFPDQRLEKENSWLRVRDEGDKITLTFKKRFGVGKNNLKDEGMHEVETLVNNFDEIAELLKSIGMVEKFYEENKRLKYRLGDIEFCIDTWPLIPPYLEIEGKKWEEVEKATLNLGFDWGKHLRCSTMQIYKKYGIDEKSYQVLTFEEQIKKNV